jgi:hypothetical protein
MITEALTHGVDERLDYGHPLEFAYFLTADATDAQGVLETARLVDRLGHDLLGVRDHPYQPRHLDTSSLLAAPPDPPTLTAFVEDVAPLVPERVAERRASVRERAEA